jgi:hypothetical protein
MKKNIDLVNEADGLVLSYSAGIWPPYGHMDKSTYDKWRFSIQLSLPKFRLPRSQCCSRARNGLHVDMEG